MTTITRAVTRSPNQLRPFDIGRDLNAVADLVEQCFADTLDAEGRRYIEHMRSAARNQRYLRWAMAVAGRVSMPLTGFVWEENGYLAGNLSLVPFTRQGERIYLIANVAVDANYRRRGIARALTEAALEYLSHRKAAAAWLHVRQENNAAADLYRALGFIERTRRTTWESLEKPPPDRLIGANRKPVGVALTGRQARFWPKQLAWLERAYPPETTWYLPLNLTALRPGVWGSLYRILLGTQVKQWAAVRAGQLVGVLAYQPHSFYEDHLWLAASPEHEEEAILAMLPYARQKLRRRTLNLDYPAGHASEAFEQAGFRKHQTLIWMELHL